MSVLKSKLSLIIKTDIITMKKVLGKHNKSEHKIYDK